MRLTLLLATTCLIALSGPYAAAQGAGTVTSTRVSFTVPAPRTERTSGRSGFGAGRPSEGTHALDGGPAPIGQTDRPSCIASVEVPGIGTLSVSCLETAESGARPAGVALELIARAIGTPETGSMETLEITLDDGATIRLRTRELVGSDPIPGRVVRATLPAVAFARVATSRSLTIVVSGIRHVLQPGDLLALRHLALALDGVPRG
jgi:hypothetical protein